jgi:hypothetical protein
MTSRVEYKQWLGSLSGDLDGYSTGSSNCYTTGSINNIIQYVSYPTHPGKIVNIQNVWDNTPTTIASSVYNIQYQMQNGAWQYQVQDGAWNWCNSLMAGMQYTCGGGLGQPPETAEEQASRLKRIEADKAKKKAASLRAEHLLFSILTPSQVRQYTDDDYFDVAIEDRVYRIRKGYSRNIELIEAGKPVAKLCAHPADAYSTPVPDAMLAQLLMLKHNESGFLKIANRTVLQ